MTTILMLMVLFFHPQRLPDQARMLDVGQGLSVMFSAAGETLIYDVGARFSQHFDAGSAIVLPTLIQAGGREVSQLIISHADNDHAGGLDGLLDLSQRIGMPVRHFLSGQKLPTHDLPLCQDDSGEWHQLHAALKWRVLNLTAAERQRVHDSDNNASCVVQVMWFEQLFLLPGDLEGDGERALLEHYGDGLASDVLVLGHHGSITSSTADFLDVVQPQEIWISSGFHNRFGHPHKDVIARLQQRQIPFFNTADTGAVIRLDGQSVTHPVHGWRAPWQQP